MLGFESIGKMLMTIGLLLLVVGALIHFAGSFFPLGRLPGDFQWQKGNFSFHFPIVTSIIVSVILTVLVNLFFGDRGK